MAVPVWDLRSGCARMSALSADSFSSRYRMFIMALNEPANTCWRTAAVGIDHRDCSCRPRLTLNESARMTRCTCIQHGSTSMLAPAQRCWRVVVSSELPA